MEQNSHGFDIIASRQFSEWQASVGASIAFTTYRSGEFFLLGLNADGTIGAFERTFDRCTGVGAFPKQRSLILATRYQLVRFDEVPKTRTYELQDALFAPHQTWITGDLDVRDIAILPEGLPIFVSTLYSCVATVSSGFSFKPLWHPSFINRLAPEDCCHLNGMALENGRPRYVTMVAASNIAQGWRDRKADGGVVWDIATQTPLAEGLSIPHSPRLHAGRLWLLNSGTGELGFIEPQGSPFRPVVFVPGFARGLAIIGRHAVVGVSLPRDQTGFRGLVLERTLQARGAEPRCGLIVVDLETGDIVAWLRIGKGVREIFDVAILTGVRNPALIGFRTNEIEQIVSIDDDERWRRA